MPSLMAPSDVSRLIDDAIKLREVGPQRFRYLCRLDSKRRHRGSVNGAGTHHADDHGNPPEAQGWDVFGA